MSEPVPPSGEQYEIAGGGYRAVVTQCGAGLRVLEHDGAPLVQAYAEDEMASGGRGQLLLPWPNRIRDGRYRFGDRDLQLPLSEPSRHNASHGLTRWCSWTLLDRRESTVRLGYRLMAQPGYPWTLALEVAYTVDGDGLSVTASAANLSGSGAPYARGAHPYLLAGDGPVDGWELRVPGSTRLVTDDQKIPVGREPVDGTPYDFREGRRIGDLPLDTAYTDLDRDADGRVAVEVRDPDAGRGVALWGDGATGWVQVYSGDDLSEEQRRTALAVEPMTAPADAFNSGQGVVVLAPAGEDGDRHEGSWGISALR